jgi:hypothetical protein
MMPAKYMRIILVSFVACNGEERDFDWLTFT